MLVAQPDAGDDYLTLDASTLDVVQGVTVNGSFYPSVNAVAARPQITATFTPAGGALNLTQAAAIVGVDQVIDHFNWTQTLTLPTGWKAFEVSLPSQYITLGDYTGNQFVQSASGTIAIPDAVVGSDGSFYEFQDLNGTGRYDPSDEESTLVKFTATPLGGAGILDPLEQDTGPNTNFLILVSSTGVGEPVAIQAPNSAAAWQKPDQWPFYFDEGDEIAYYSNHNTYLSFKDGPSLSVGGAVQFNTELTGVYKDETSRTWPGYGANFEWESDGTNVTGVNYWKITDPATIPPVASGGVFNVQVGLGIGVTTNPTSQVASAGNPVSFVAAAAGSPTPTVQWQMSTDGGNTFSNVAGAISATFTFNTTAAQNSDEYRAVFTNSSGTATSAPATLTVNTQPGGLVISAATGVLPPIGPRQRFCGCDRATQHRQLCRVRQRRGSWGGLPVQRSDRRADQYPGRSL